jgi:hypothetical protein
MLRRGLKKKKTFHDSLMVLSSRKEMLYFLLNNKIIVGTFSRRNEIYVAEKVYKERKCLTVKSHDHKKFTFFIFTITNQNFTFNHRG